MWRLKFLRSGAGLAVIFISLLMIVSCSDGGDEASSTPAASVTASASPADSGPATGTAAPTPAPSGQEAALDVPEAGGAVALAAGSYRTARFQPEAHFAVGDGWSAAFDTVRLVHLYRGGNADANCVCLVNPDGVFETNGGEKQPLPSGGTVEGLIHWLVANANLKTSNPSSLQVGDLSGRQLDVEVRSGVVPVDEVVYLSAGDRVFGVKAGERQHLTVLDFRGSPLIVAQRSPAAEYNTYFAFVEQIVGSLTFSN